MKTGIAIWHAHLRVECPYCEDYQEILYDEIIDEWWLIFPICESVENIDYIHKCTECEKEFKVESTCW